MEARPVKVTRRPNPPEFGTGPPVQQGDPAAKGRYRPAALRVSGRRGDRLVARPSRLEIRDEIFVSQGEPDVVEALQEAPAGVVVDLEGGDDLAGPDRPADQVDGDLRAGVVLQVLPDQLDVVLR